MKFSKKSRYGVAALIDLAVNSKNGHVALGSIAERNEISPQYLEQVFASLRRAGIVKSVKGSQGGYLLKYPSSSITVASIIQALEGTYYLDDEETKTEESAAGIAETIQEDIVDRVNHGLDQILQNLTLADLEERQMSTTKKTVLITGGASGISV